MQRNEQFLSLSLSAQPKPPQLGQGVRAAPTSSGQLSTTCSEAEAFLASEGKDPPPL